MPRTTTPDQTSEVSGRFCLGFTLGRAPLAARGWVLLFSCMLTIANGTGSTAAAAIRGADNPQAYTERQFVEEVAAFHDRVIVQAYREHGHRDPRWDDAAEQLLAHRSAAKTNFRSPELLDRALPLTASEAQALAQELAASDCRDALVLFARCRSQSLSGEARVELARETYEAMAQSPYDLLWRYRAATYLAYHLNAQDMDEEYEAFRPTVVEELVRYIAEGDLPGRTPRYAFAWIASLRNEMPIEDRGEVARQLAERDAVANPWLADLYRGRYHVAAAWEARGTGWTHDVEQEGWMGFAEHLAAARPLLERAWEAKPEWPEPATFMISVAMGEGSGEQRRWFDRATQAQLDYSSAYTRYRQSIRPRWGGSLDALRQFAIECIDTGRFDTRAPLQGRDTLHTLRTDASHDLWRHPDIVAAVDRLYEGIVEEPEAPMPADLARSWQAAFHWRIGNHEKARSLLEPLEERVSHAGFEKYGGQGPMTVSEIFARTGRATAMIDTAEDFANRGMPDRAAEAYAQALLRLPPDDPGRAHIRHHQVMQAWRHQDLQGEWLDLLQSDDLTGFTVQGGDWRRDGQGHLVGEPGRNGMRLACDYDLSYRMELRGRAVMVLGDGDAPNVCVFFALQHRDNTFYHRNVLFYPDRGVMLATSFRWNQQRFETKFDHAFDFHIQLWDGQVRVSVDDEIVVEQAALRALPQRTQPFAVGGWYGSSHEAVTRFEQLEARRLTTRPAWVHEEPQDD